MQAPGYRPAVGRPAGPVATRSAAQRVTGDLGTVRLCRDRRSLASTAPVLSIELNRRSSTALVGDHDGVGLPQVLVKVPAGRMAHDLKQPGETNLALLRRPPGCLDVEGSLTGLDD